jgi:hypothetical protein
LGIILRSENLFYNENDVQNYNDPPFCDHLNLNVVKKLAEYYDHDKVLKNVW